jgi:hypothetical protein
MHHVLVFIVSTFLNFAPSLMHVLPPFSREELSGHGEEPPQPDWLIIPIAFPVKNSFVNEERNPMQVRANPFDLNGDGPPVQQRVRQFPQWEKGEEEQLLAEDHPLDTHPLAAEKHHTESPSKTLGSTTEVPHSEAKNQGDNQAEKQGTQPICCFLSRQRED